MSARSIATMNTADIVTFNAVPSKGNNGLAVEAGTRDGSRWLVELPAPIMFGQSTELDIGHGVKAILRWGKHWQDGQGFISLSVHLGGRSFEMVQAPLGNRWLTTTKATDGVPNGVFESAFVQALRAAIESDADFALAQSRREIEEKDYPVGHPAREW
jgi:hypothetical protein